MRDINWKIGGVGGMGAMGVGLMFAKVFFRSGYSVTDYNEYNSIIKGGHNSYQVRVSDDKVLIVSKKVDLLLALDEYTIGLFPSVSTRGFLLCDWALVKNKEGIDPTKVIDVPFGMINKSNGGDEIMKNIVGLGASLALLNADFEIAKKIITDQFAKKGNDIINKNITLLELGYKYVLEKFPDQVQLFQKDFGNFSNLNNTEKRFYPTGNEATALGAVSAGIGYFAAYPMTPASSVLHYLAPIAKEYSIVVKHVEDEIAAVNSAIGASYAGVRSMTATSGGGFSLMVEGLGMAAITETPIVIGLMTRPGPSTGMPTWTDQGDLRFALHASQGEFLRLVFTPGDPEECFYFTRLAFDLSEKYQLPAIILYDKALAEGHWSCLSPDNKYINKRNSFISKVALDRVDKYERYADTSSGITPRSIPGMSKGEHLANSDEHNYYGLSEESQEIRKIQLNKRYTKKLIRVIQELPANKIYGDQSNKTGIITFGTGKNCVIEAMKTVKDCKLLNLTTVAPFPIKDVMEFINSIDKLFIVENNFTGQLAGLIRENTGKLYDDILLKDDGQPIFYEEVIEFLQKHAN